MKNFFLLSLAILLFAACEAPPETTRMNEILREDMIEKAVEQGDMTQHMQGIPDSTHIGCQEGEVVNGVCVPATEGEQNADLFESVDELPVAAEDVVYLEGFGGYLAQPEAEGEYPGVVMIHEWWGLNDNIRTMAKLMANEGYVVLAVDLYGEVTDESSRAGELASAARADTEATVANLRSAVAYLRELPAVQDERIASMGWCFGGQQSLNLALASDDLAATVIYYGQLVSDKERLQSIDWPILGVFGSEDTSIPVAEVEAFNQALKDLNIEQEIYMYRGVGHAFANPSGSRYAPDETRDAWQKTIDFLDKHLKNE